MIGIFQKKGDNPFQFQHVARGINFSFSKFVMTLAACFLSVGNVQAFETTKASALIMDTKQQTYSLSFQKPPSAMRADPCLTFLRSSRLSNDETVRYRARRNADPNAVPVALGFVLGVRVALGPSDIVKPYKRVQFGPELIARQDERSLYALSIAAYRSCKNEQALALSKNNRPKQ